MGHEGRIEGIGVAVDEGTDRVPAVIIAADDRYIPIMVTPDQARAIHLGMHGNSFERPLTHDLLVEMVTDLGGAIDQVRIDALRGGTFLAKVDTEQYREGSVQARVFDARPSDAIAIAVRADCPIEVAAEVVAAAGQDPEELDLLDPDDIPDHEGT
jgi:bifunctional DNase/RNase